MYRKTVELMQQSGIDPADKILDIGYGNGYFLQQADRKCGAELYGIDISADMKTTAERRNRGAKEAGRLHLEIGDCCDLPYEDEMFAAAASINTVYFWEDTVQGLSEIRRVLKPGVLHGKRLSEIRAGRTDRTWKTRRIRRSPCGGDRLRQELCSNI